MSYGLISLTDFTKFTSYTPHPSPHMIYRIQIISRVGVVIEACMTLLSRSKFLGSRGRGRNLDENRLVEAYINPPTFTVILQPKVVNTFSYYQILNQT